MRKLFGIAARPINLTLGKWRLTAGPWNLCISSDDSGESSAAGQTRRTVFSVVQLLAGAAVAVWALVLCWKGVSWAFHPKMFPILDEVGDFDWILRVTYRQLLRLFPIVIYCDRPIGFAYLRLLYEQFGFNYRVWLVSLLCIHFGNCILFFALLRRLGTRLPLAFAGLAAFGCLWPTAMSATYFGGGSPDTICTLFLLGSTHFLLSERRWHWLLSATLYLLALRTKEWGIVAPVFLTMLVAVRLFRSGETRNPRRLLTELFKRLWPHYLILLIFGGIYLSLAQQLRSGFGEGTPYHIDLRPISIFRSYVYYTSMIAGTDETARRWIAFALFVAICIYALVRRRGMIVFGALAYVATLFPMSLIPNQRIPYYAYGPQVFLILVFCLFAQDVVDELRSRPRLRLVAALCLAVLILGHVTHFRKSGIFRNRINWLYIVRGECWQSAHDADAQLAHVGRGASVYVESGDATPWLFVPGP